MAAKLYELCNYWKNWLYSKQPARHSQNLPMKWKNRSNIFIGLTITVFCVWLAFRKVPFTELSDVISGGNLGDPTMLSAGIAQALITTVTGLAIAIPFIFLYQYLSHRIEMFILSTEKVVNEILNFCKSHGGVQP